MEQSEAKRRIAYVTAGIVTTLLDVGKAPNGVIYTAAMSHVDFVTYTEIITLLQTQGVLLCKSNVLSLTPKGEELAHRINLAIQRSR